MTEPIPDPGCIPLLLFQMMDPEGVPSCHSAWLTSDVIGLSLSIEAEEAYDRLPILADALEEAGCSDPLILSHCRQHREHEIHCWVLGLIREDAIAVNRSADSDLSNPPDDPTWGYAVEGHGHPPNLVQRLIWHSCRVALVILAGIMAFAVLGMVLTFFCIHP